MQLLSVIRARSIWLFDTLDLNPFGKHLEVIEWLKENYHFLKYPSSIADFDRSGGLAFSNGAFQIKDDLVIDVGLSIYPDGLVADTRSSTKDTDVFLENLLSLAERDLGLVSYPEMVRQRLYVSELNIRPKNPLNSLNPRLQEFANRITSLLVNQDTIVFAPAGISFWPDPSFPIRHSHFQFERKQNIPFSENRYYSRAPLHTDDHLKLLEEFEDLLIG
jgi:hypothetical protein